MDIENTILQQIQQNIEALQKQIDSMKPVDTSLEVPVMFGGPSDKLKEKADNFIRAMQDAVEENGASVVFTINDNSGRAVFYSVTEPEKIDENAVAAAIDAFSSPKRINIIKALLAEKYLSSNELTMKTGCIGGQLYHHLSALENARIICKSNEMYTLTPYGKNMITAILCLVYGEEF